ncbi:alpha-L-fucosidase [Niabella hirudinis]|uniref:alpha-L-fucosidase n=1 Tax=Niabella hirudinis TaxID=1285929 RepID=UPI003EC1444C
MKRFFLLFLFAAVTATGFAQVKGEVHDMSAGYQYPAEPLVRQKLDQWQDLKIGVFLHWGIYSVEGIQESWLLCNRPNRPRDTTKTYDDFKKWYWGLASKFNPVKFNPERWAEISKNAGMKYIVFTTKHHDGFNMFDTKYSDYKITNGPFKNNPRADVTKYIFDAYRKQGMAIGAYFSKPDWHNEDFWWPVYGTTDRNMNYDPVKYAGKWKRFQEFTFNQLSELMHNYGKIDVLWFDGGWVRPLETPRKPEEGLILYPKFSQDVNMPRIAQMARKAQPDVLIADRTVHGPYENFRTPEQAIPKIQLKEPWETCITLTKSWSYRKPEEEKVKSSAWVIHTLAEVVAKGGNMLLGFGPTPEGEFPKEVTQPLAELGAWLKVNGEAIYGTRITENYNDGSTWFTQSKDGKKKYAIVCIKEGEMVPAILQWKGNIPVKNGVVRLLATGKPVPWKSEGDAVMITVPKMLAGKKIPALVLAF